MWNLDDTVTITPAALELLRESARRKSERGYKPTTAGRRAVRDLQQAVATIEALPFVVRALCACEEATE